MFMSLGFIPFSENREGAKRRQSQSSFCCQHSTVNVYIDADRWHWWLWFGPQAQKERISHLFMMLTGPNMSLFYDILSNPFRYIMVLLSRKDIIHRCRTSDPFILHYFSSLTMVYWIRLISIPTMLDPSAAKFYVAQQFLMTFWSHA